MLVADTYLGNVAEEDVATRVERTDPLSVTLTDTERRRSRVRTTAEDGTDLGIVVAESLADGDVLVADDRLVLVSLAAIEAMVLTFERAVLPSGSVALGHAIGNRHWPLAIDDGRVLLPVVETRERMEALIEPLAPEGTALSYEAVAPTTFDAGSDDPHADAHSGGGYSHPHGDDHAHPHEHHRSHDDTHSNGDERDHEHERDRADENRSVGSEGSSDA